MRGANVSSSHKICLVMSCYVDACATRLLCVFLKPSLKSKRLNERFREIWSLPWSVSQSEASLQSNAAVHHQLAEEQRRVAGWTPRRVPRRHFGGAGGRVPLQLEMRGPLRSLLFWTLWQHVAHDSRVPLSSQLAKQVSSRGMCRSLTLLSQHKNHSLHLSPFTRAEKSSLALEITGALIESAIIAMEYLLWWTRFVYITWTTSLQQTKYGSVIYNEWTPWQSLLSGPAPTLRLLASEFQCLLVCNDFLFQSPGAQKSQRTSGAMQSRLQHSDFLREMRMPFTCSRFTRRSHMKALTIKSKVR